MIKYLKLLRIKQYIKNIFFFLPLIFGGALFNADILMKTTAGAVLFSLASSAVYIINDINDVNEDKKHPQKCLRPIASGEISIKNGCIISVMLLILSLTGAYILNKLFAVLMFTYLVINFLYSIRLKHIPIIDISIISTGFLIRILCGAVLSSIKPSEYLILMTFLISMFIAFAKRYDDVILYENGTQARKNIQGYNKEFILISMSVLAAVNIVAYILYTLTPQLIQQFNSAYLYLSSFIVIIGFLRYFQLTFVNKITASPTEILYKDKFIILTVIFWMIYMIFIVYL